MSLVHYHVWFDLKTGVTESDGLAVVGEFLDGLCGQGDVKRSLVLKNKGGPRTKLPKYHALIEFEDDAQFAAAMRHQAARGIHSGGHGRVIDVVSGFHVEIFTAVEEPAELAGACAI